MDLDLFDPDHPHWNAEVERIEPELGAPDNATLFPHHFISVVLRRIGGRIAVFSQNGRRVGVGFLYPRRPPPDRAGCARAYTLRYHPITGRGGADSSPILDGVVDDLVAAVEAQLPGSCVVFYDPLAGQRYAATSQQLGDVNIGRPGMDEVAQIPDLQRRIWGSLPKFLYPSDIHGLDFGLGSSLVARVGEQLAAFLFGFIKFGGPALPSDWRTRFNGDLRLESQLMGVLPDYRGMRIGSLIKRMQGEQAWNEGIGVVHWTVDPLQFSNAALNFGLLRAVAFNFYPDLYPFRNALNMVHASRFAITWLVGSRRVRDTPLFGTRTLMLDISHQRQIARVNRGWTDVNYTLDNQIIAIEIPANWTRLQAEDIGAAMAWRETTDRIFARYIGCEPGKYVITGVGVDGQRRFLIGERADEKLWAHLGRE